jgi:hypothetical protein
VAKKSRRKEPDNKSRAQAARGRIYIHLIILVLLTVGVFAGMAVFISHSRHTGAQSTAAQAAEGFDRLQGRWQRPDGGYVLEIRDVDTNGKMMAAYFNPRPINVSQAEAALNETTLKVFIELRDVNYPGATYHLTYDADKDQLQGVYFQPALQQKFDVFFVRMK